MMSREKLLSRLARRKLSRKYVDLAIIAFLFCLILFDQVVVIVAIVSVHVMILLFVWSSLFKVEEQQKKALEEDPSVFDYDGVYDKMKEKSARPLIQDREERKVWLQV